MEDTQFQVRINQFLRWHLLVSFVSAAFYCILAAIYESVTLWYIVIITIVVGLLLIPAWSANRQGDVRGASNHVVMVFLLSASFLVVIIPGLYPALILAPIIGIVTALPYLRGRDFVRTIGANIAGIIWICAIGITNPQFAPVLPLLLLNTTILSAVAFEAMLIAMLIWQYKQRLHIALDLIRITNASLEQKIADRTKELQTRNIELEEANELKNRFLANMSHELRTPLNVIIGMTHLLSEVGTFNEEQSRLQQRVRVNADHLLGLINDVLDVAKIESGWLELHIEPFDIVLLLESVRSSALGLTKDKPIDVEVQVPCAMPLVHGDKTRIRQIVLNLVSNAAKFTSAGTIVLQAESTPDYIRIAVIDSGIGISPQYYDMIFQEFRQGDDTMMREYGGTGLGLPISKKLVDLHGGTMGVESTLGKGSTFFFTLPLTTVDNELSTA